MCIYFEFSFTEAEKGQSKNNFQIEKNFKSQYFFQILVGKFVKSKKTITNPNKNIGFTNKFFTNKKIVRNPKIDVKSRKYFENRKKKMSRAIRAPTVSLRQRLGDIAAILNPKCHKRV